MMTTRLILVLVACIWSFIPYLSTNVPKLELFEAGKCVISENDMIKTNTSYHECLKHCKLRADCVAISYIQEASVCRLNYGVDTSGICTGYVYSRKATWENGSSVFCSCPSEKQCKQNGDCKPSECGKLDKPDHGQMFGTQFSLGDKVTFQCDIGYVLQGNRTRACTPSGTWSGRNITCVEVQDCIKYLVSGPDGVKDSQLTASSFWCDGFPFYRGCDYFQAGYSARYARINSTGYYTGSWSAYSNTINEYIQVDFLVERIISGIVLQGRFKLKWVQYVTEFKVLYSLNCADFMPVTSEDGVVKHFQGNISPNDPVTRYLPDRVMARCIRINPTKWENHVSLRFDVLGC